ncbi:MAG: hypothetical protein NUW22_05020 [Acidobacteria bacterium]|nr:hypothetical protein [Acidobacteriota bacterium]
MADRLTEAEVTEARALCEGLSARLADGRVEEGWRDVMALVSRLREAHEALQLEFDALQEDHDAVRYREGATFDELKLRRQELFAVGADRDRLAGEVERLTLALTNHLCQHDMADWMACAGGHDTECVVCQHDKGTEHTWLARAEKAEAEVARLTALVPTPLDAELDVVVRDHVWELQQEVIRLNDENNARREQWEALKVAIQSLRMPGQMVSGGSQWTAACARDQIARNLQANMTDLEAQQ